MSDPEQTKLDELEADIDETRRAAEEHGSIPPSDEPTLADPDGDGDVDDHEVQPPG